MGLFEFLMVLVSVVIGLGLTEILTGVANLIRVRDQVRLYWIHVAFQFGGFFALLQQWWEFWDMEGLGEISFMAVLAILGPPIFLFLIANLLYPRNVEGVDLDLAGRLAGLGGLIDDVVEEQLYAKEISLRFVVPYVGDVIRSTEHVRAAYFASERPVGQGLTYRTHVDFPNSTVIRGGLERMRVTYFASTFELQGLPEELDAIQELLGS